MKNHRTAGKRSLRLERLESRIALSVSYLPDPVLSIGQVQLLLDRASAAAVNPPSAPSRHPPIRKPSSPWSIGTEISLASAWESGVAFSSAAEEVFAIDGAVAEARTAALFSSDFPDGSPLSSRAIQFISQSTITQREVDSSPESTNPTAEGPGFVAPIGLGGLFPPGVDDTSAADLFWIEGTNRDTLMDPGRFNTPTYVTGFNAMISYGQASGLLPSAQPRGIGTLPGGVPIYESNDCVGGIGVFFPGPNGYASYEQNNLPGTNQTQVQRENSPLCEEAEWMAFAAVGGSTGAGLPVGSNQRRARDSPARSIFPSCQAESVWEASRSMTSAPTGPILVPLAVKHEGALVSPGGTASNATVRSIRSATSTCKSPVPYGWLVAPRVSPDGSSPLTVASVTTIIDQGVTEANLDRSQIRLPLGSTPSMVLCVTDQDGNILGLYCMPNETEFSLDVAVAKARNTAYYDGPNLQPSDQLAGIPLGTAFTNRTFRYLAEPRYPGGRRQHARALVGLNDPGINPATAEDSGATRCPPRSICRIRRANLPTRPSIRTAISAR